MGMEILSLVSNLVLIAIIAWQTYLLRKQIKTDVEKEKRISTVNLLSSFLRNFDRNLIVARKLTEELKQDDVKKIFRFEEIDLSSYPEEKKLKIKGFLFLD